MNQDEKNAHASLDACILESTYDPWRSRLVIEEHDRTMLAKIAARWRQRLGPAEARSAPLPFPPAFAAECERQAQAVAAHDPAGVEIEAETAALYDWPDD